MIAVERSNRDTGWILFQTEGGRHIYPLVSVPRIRSACQSKREHVSVGSNCSNNLAKVMGT